MLETWTAVDQLIQGLVHLPISFFPEQFRLGVVLVVLFLREWDSSKNRSLEWKKRESLVYNICLN